MRDYQREYINNCRAHRELTGLPFQTPGEFEQVFHQAIDNMRRARELADRNTKLLQEDLLPVLDDLYQQPEETLREIESFADALTEGPQALDLALADQIHSALLSVARRSGRREVVIRELYKLGMVRYGIWNMFTGLPLSELEGPSLRMRYCFMEASGYLKYYDEFDEETKGYILRSLANIYLGSFKDWKEKLSCVRRSMEVFTDERYRASAPGLPWDRFMDQLHRQMVSVLPHDEEEGTLSPETIVDVMESAHLIYEVQYEAARKSGKPLEARRLMPYYSVEFACGLMGREKFLHHMETLMDMANPEQYDSNTDYQIISMAAFYCQYLKRMPELLRTRSEYLNQLYVRAIRYIEAIPVNRITDQVRLYVRQMLTVFLELPGGVTYRELTMTMMTRFAPELYAQGYAVGGMSRELCLALLAEDEHAFDDIPEVRGQEEPDARRQLVAELAMDAGLMHDVGKLNFSNLYDHAGRQMLRVEEVALRLHSEVGWHRLRECPSTSPFADVARGHHRWYDGSDGYPDSYDRQESPYRVLVDVVALADFLEMEREDDTGLPCRSVDFEEKLAECEAQAGKRFSPQVTGVLRDPQLRERLKTLYDNGRKEGYYRCFLHTVRKSGDPDSDSE